MKLSFDDGVALVAGGSGGIGAAVVRRLVEDGLPVAFTYNRGSDAAEKLEKECGREAKVRAYRWGASGFGDAAALTGRVADEMGPIRFLTDATGLAQERAFHRLDEPDAQRLIEVNLTGVIALARAVIVPMMKKGDGRIALLGSVSGQRGLKGHTVYAATKAGLEGFVRSLAHEAAAFGVTVNCIAPGFIDTPMLEAVPENERDKWHARIPLGRLGRPEEVAGLVAFVLSREAAYLTGQTLTLDGGVSL